MHPSVTEAGLETRCWKYVAWAALAQSECSETERAQYVAESAQREKERERAQLLSEGGLALAGTGR